ncbi:reprolysin-like metallopeptidase [Chryseobacterium contaminans]|uniref:reprolysin-like metallopeptidase n=1 Tax=Chryseobacterium contaminans TaxID=1423959 RepID=UPI003018FAD6
MKKKVLLISALALGMASTYGQRWEPASQKRSQIREEVEVQQSYTVDLQSLRNILKKAVETGKEAQAVTVSLPTAEGKIEKFAVYSDPVMEKSIADNYQLGSYVGVGIDDPSKYLRFSTSPTEMQSMIIKDGKFQFIEPITTDKRIYGVFYKTRRTEGKHGFECSTEEKDIKGIQALESNGKKSLSNLGITNRISFSRYRTYRLALSATGEYTQYFMTQANVPANATDAEKRAPALIAMNNTMTRVNGVFEKDFGIRVLIQNLPNIIYINPTTDPYNGDLRLNLQQNLTNVVGNANYDMGHVFNAAGGDGNAGSIASTCVNPATANTLAKGSAYTQSTMPTGDTFDIDYVAHEMGHQLGANHTFSHTSEDSGVNVEPGGGTTIMGYAGITDDNVAMNSDAYFHYSSINQVLASLGGKPNCGTSEIINNNTAPVIASLPAYTIPKETAYYLDASATDAENNAMTYTWEQYDSVGAQNTISGDSGWGYNPEGSLTRSFTGTATGRRYFPSQNLVMNGILTNKPTWETVSYIPRTLHYAVTVRDQNAQRSMLSTAETTVTVGNDGPFKFNGLTTTSALYNNALNIIYWEVANTNLAPYNAANVKIDYTTDNGVTWTNLAASVPNTGSYSAQMPTNLSGAVKLRISAIGNVFYAVSPAVTVGPAPTSTTAAPTGISAIETEIFKTTARISWNRIPGATYSINYRKTGTINWQNTTSQTNSVILNNLEDETSYEVQVAGVINTVSGAFSNNYTFKTKALKTGIDYCILKSGTPSYSAIYSVAVANINQPRTGAQYKAYRDFSEDPAKIIELNRGAQYNLRVETVVPKSYSYLSSRPVRFNAWIDYNRDGIFSASERVLSFGGNNYSVSTYIPASVNFIVPNTAYAGNKLLRMRIVAKYGNTDVTDVCGSILRGSIMDFPVRITDNNPSALRKAIDEKSSEVSIYPNPAETFVEVKNLKEAGDYKIYSADGRLVQEGKLDGQKINVASLVKGMYVMTINDGKNTYNTKLIKK